MSRVCLLQNPIDDYSVAIDLEEWFAYDTAHCKREQLRQLIIDLKDELNPSLEYDPVADGCQTMCDDSEMSSDVATPRTAAEAQRTVEELVQNAIQQQTNNMPQLQPQPPQQLAQPPQQQQQQQQFVVVNAQQVVTPQEGVVTNRFATPAPVSNPTPMCLISSHESRSEVGMPKQPLQSNRTYSKAKRGSGSVVNTGNLSQMIKSGEVPVNDVVQSVVQNALQKHPSTQRNINS